MMQGTLRHGIRLALLAACVMLAGAGHAQQGYKVGLVTRGLGGGTANGSSANVDISDDGSVLVFESLADNLEAGDTNFVTDIFAYSGGSDSVSRVSEGSGGTQANGESVYPQISRNGRYVLFLSSATNLAGGDVGLFVKDLQTGDVTLESLRPDGTNHWSVDASSHPRISDDGNIIVWSENINDEYYLYRRNRGTNTTVELISASPNPIVIGDIDGAGNRVLYDELETDGLNVTSRLRLIDVAFATNTVLLTSTTQDYEALELSTGGGFALYGIVSSGVNSVRRLDLTTMGDTLISVVLRTASSAMSPDGGSVAFAPAAGLPKTGFIARNLGTSVEYRLVRLLDGTLGLPTDFVQAKASNALNAVAFVSESDQIVADDLNTATDIFLSTITGKVVGRDVLFQQTTASFRLAFRQSENLAFTSWQPILNAPSPGWTLRGVANMVGTGNSDDLIWQSASGKVGFWRMTGAIVDAWEPVANSVSPGWTIVGFGDFDGGGSTDIVFQHTSRSIGLWRMNGTSVLGWVPIGRPSPGFVVRGVGDFTGDGQPDILLQNTTSRGMGIWAMNGTTVTGWQGLSHVPAPGLVFVGLGDYNADNQADLTFFDPVSRRITVWLMNGTNRGLAAYLGGHVSPDWQPVGVGSLR